MAVFQLPHPWADAVIIGTLSTAGLIAGFRKHRASLVLLGAAVIFSTFWVPAGAQLGGQDVIPICIFVGLLVGESVRGRFLDTLPIPKTTVLVVVGLGAVATVSSWLAPVMPPSGPGGLQAPVNRPFVQAASYIIMLLFFLIPNWISIGTRELTTVARGIQGAVAAGAAYGVYQLIAFRLGLPFRGIHYFQGTVAQEGLGIMRAGGVSLFRMSGLSNEPKQLAAVSIVAFVMALLSSRLYKYSGMRWVVLATCGAAFVGAWSTGGLLAGVLVCFAALVWIMTSARQALKRVFQMAGGIVLVAAAAVVLSGEVDQALKVVGDITFGRVELPLVPATSGAGRRIENAVIDHFLSHPLSLITGVGLGNYPYVVGDAGQWVSDVGIQPMHSLPLTLLADFGLISLVVLGGVIIRVSARGRFRLTIGDQQDAKTSAYGVVLSGLITAVLVSVFLNLLPLVLLFLGVLYSFHRREAVLKGKAKRYVFNCAKGNLSVEY